LLFEPGKCFVGEGFYGKYYAVFEVLGNGLGFFVAFLVEAVDQGDFAVGGQALAAE